MVGNGSVITGISFDAAAGQTVSLADVRSSAFKFGVHIQALDGDRSEKLINMTPAVPEP